jgi:hypothetical protein
MVQCCHLIQIFHIHVRKNIPYHYNVIQSALLMLLTLHINHKQLTYGSCTSKQKTCLWAVSHWGAPKFSTSLAYAVLCFGWFQSYLNFVQMLPNYDGVLFQQPSDKSKIHHKTYSS